MIRFEKVTKIYPPDNVVLQDISFEIKKGEFVSIAGKSGAGKTTLIRLILGLEKPTSGSVFFEEKIVANLSGDEIQQLRRKVGCIYQDYKLLSSKTVYENVAYVMEVGDKDSGEISDRVPKVLEVMGLGEKANSFPSELSGGEQQRLAVARALVNQPEVVIADEPTGNLDPYNTYEVVSLLKKINQSGKTVILLTHDKFIIDKLGKRVITIEDGRILRDEEKGRFIP